LGLEHAGGLLAGGLYHPRGGRGFAPRGGSGALPHRKPAKRSPPARGKRTQGGRRVPRPQAPPRYDKRFLLQPAQAAPRDDAAPVPRLSTSLTWPADAWIFSGSLASSPGTWQEARCWSAKPEAASPT